MWTEAFDLGVVLPLAFPESRESEEGLMASLDYLLTDTDFGAVELGPIADKSLREKVRSLTALAQVQVVYLPILPMIYNNMPLGSADRGARQTALQQVQQLIDEATEVGATLAMVASPPDPGPEAREAMVERLAEDLRALSDYADSRSHYRRLFLTLENFDRDVEKKRLIGPTVEAAALARAIDRDNFGLTIDLSHLPLLQEHPADALNAAQDVILHAHIGNCVADNPNDPLYGDFHPRFGYPSSANDVDDVLAYLQALRKVNYFERVAERLGSRPIVSFEIKTQPGESPRYILANGKRTVARALSRL
jgi:sugar phosphate isomerase/epimerase